MSQYSILNELSYVHLSSRPRKSSRLENAAIVIEEKTIYGNRQRNSAEKGGLHIPIAVLISRVIWCFTLSSGLGMLIHSCISGSRTRLEEFGRAAFENGKKL